MRLLFIGDLAATGFGTVTNDLGLQFLAQGHDVRFLSQNELGELPEPFASRTFVINENREGWITAEFSIGGIINGTLWPDGWAPEAVLMVSDYYATRTAVFIDPESELAFSSVPSFHYAPIEGSGLPKAWRRLWDVITPIAMSRFGADQIAQVTGIRPEVVYHGVDQDVFYPITPEHPGKIGNVTVTSKQQCRSMFQLGFDWTIILRTDANVPRKTYPQMLRGLVPVLESHPDAYVLMHTRTQDQGGNLRDIVLDFPRDIANRMRNTGYYDSIGVGLPREALNILYNAADIYVSTSPEGFGLTVAEAIACGVPAVGLDYSAVPEVIGPAGLVVPISHLYDNPYSHKWAYIDEDAFGRAVSRLIDNPKERLRKGRLGPEHVAANFTWSHAAAQMAAIFTERIERRAAA